MDPHYNCKGIFISTIICNSPYMFNSLSTNETINKNGIDQPVSTQQGIVNPPMGLDRLRLQGPCWSISKSGWALSNDLNQKQCSSATGGEIRVEVSHIFIYFPMLFRLFLAFRAPKPSWPSWPISGGSSNSHSSVLGWDHQVSAENSDPAGMQGDPTTSHN